MSWLRTAGSSAGARDTARARRLLIVIQTAVALALLAGSGLLIRSLAKLQDVGVGFRSEGVLTAQVQLPQSRYALPAAHIQFPDDVLARLAGRPNVVSAGAISELPMSDRMNSFEIDGRPTSPSEKLPHAETWSASPGYFGTLGIPLKRGRVFDDADRASTRQVAVVSQSLVDTYFSSIDPLGHSIDFEGGGSGPHRWREIVGVVDDVHDRRLDGEPGPQIYVPYAQRATAGLFLVVRASGSPLDVLPDIRAAVRSVDPSLPVFNMTTMAQLESRTTRDRRVARAALSGFAAAAVLLAALGLYGLLAQVVRDRGSEIGVRMALGASPADVMRQFLVEGGGLIAQGVGMGVIASLAATRLLQGLVFGVTTMDPVTYGAAAGLLSIVALAACALPAWRAARVDPLQALRLE